MLFVSIWFVAAQILAAASDALTLRIPNALILFLLAGFAAMTALSAPGWTDLAASVAVGLVLLAGGAVLFSHGLMGGGDVKLLAVTGLWLGPGAAPAFLVLTALVGGVLSLALLACRALGAERLAGARVATLRPPMNRVPYGIAIAVAAIAVLFTRPEAALAG